jgi:hypothetical protein
MAWKRTTRDKYWEMLEVLPPAAMSGGGFLVGEPIDHTPDGWPRYEAFLERDGKFFVHTEPLTVAQFNASIGFMRGAAA